MDARDQWIPNVNLPAVEPNSRFRYALLGDLTAPVGKKGELGEALRIFRAGVEQIRRWIDEEGVQLVVSIGDLVHLWGPDWHAMRNDLLAPLDGTPFVTIPGNHDVFSEETRAEWLEHWGHTHRAVDGTESRVTYTHFVQGGILFLFMDTEDFAPGAWSHHHGAISDTQFEHIRFALNRNDWDWALVFLHKPLWLDAQAPVTTHWQEIERLLAERPRHTLYAGHVHKPAFDDPRHPDRHILAATGGRSFHGHQVVRTGLSAPRGTPSHVVFEIT